MCAFLSGRQILMIWLLSRIFLIWNEWRCTGISGCNWRWWGCGVPFQWEQSRYSRSVLDFFYSDRRMVGIKSKLVSGRSRICRSTTVFSRDVLSLMHWLYRLSKGGGRWKVQFSRYRSHCDDTVIAGRSGVFFLRIAFLANWLSFRYKVDCLFSHVTIRKRQSQGHRIVSMTRNFSMKALGLGDRFTQSYYAVGDQTMYQCGRHPYARRIYNSVRITSSLEENLLVRTKLTSKWRWAVGTTLIWKIAIRLSLRKYHFGNSLETGIAIRFALDYIIIYVGLGLSAETVSRLELCHRVRHILLELQKRNNGPLLSKYPK